MSERTESYQKKVKDYVKSLGYDPRSVNRLNFPTDQDAYEYAKQLPPPPNSSEGKASLKNIWVVDGGDRVTAMEWGTPDGGRIQILDNGRIITDGNSTNMMNTLIAMKPLNQSLPDFLKDLTRREKKK